MTCDYHLGLAKTSCVTSLLVFTSERGSNRPTQQRHFNSDLLIALNLRQQLRSVIITVARDRDSDSEDCYILAVFYLFSHHRFLDVPGPIFAKLFHTTRCVLKYFISYMGVHIGAPKNLRGEKPHFCRFPQPKSIL